MDDDFNTAMALSVLFGLAREARNRSAHTGAITQGSIQLVLSTLKELGTDVLGLRLPSPPSPPSLVSQQDVVALTMFLQQALRERDDARKAGHFQVADAVRGWIDASHIAVKDPKQGATASSSAILPSGYEVQTEPGRGPKPQAPAAPAAPEIAEVCNHVRDILISKNAAYGDSALNPVRIFSKADPIDQLKVRIDDKLSRMIRGFSYENEDTILDLIGYLVLYSIAIHRQRAAQLEIAAQLKRVQERYRV